MAGAESMEQGSGRWDLRSNGDRLCEAGAIAKNLAFIPNETREFQTE